MFAEMVESGKNPDRLIDELNIAQITDETTIQGFIDAVMAAHPDQASQFQSGNQKLFGFFVGKVIQQSKGRAAPEIVNRLLKGFAQSEHGFGNPRMPRCIRMHRKTPMLTPPTLLHVLGVVNADPTTTPRKSINRSLATANLLAISSISANSHAHSEPGAGTAGHNGPPTGGMRTKHRLVLHQAIQ